ncbi:DMT family transporter [Companilactobacillus nodensis]|uniref:Small multidrug efflux protein n=1 Tax=Companilactobacillus nodensis DSM 19682 = JCM 14932 = NBRC 107160 TaxID=1423775 RepID=A0A0R1K578_9LACO|nr:multidrug efflux SMR transporter [Companilactobacillus nodensis]KRK78733.1 small multidrug efflux protein [Companilactobacillus nodensis DSM 19682 = JCM 14932 = NBRC 107160]
MNWIYLIIAGLFEVVWASMMKLSHGFTKLNFTILTIIGMIISFVLLAKATKTLPLSIAYPIWTGIGALGSILVGFFIFGDKVSPITWIFITLLLISIIGIKFTTSS